MMTSNKGKSKVTTAGGAFLLGYILAKVKVNRYGLLFVTAGIVEGIAFFVTGMNSLLPLVFLAALALGATINRIPLVNLIGYFFICNFSRCQSPLILSLNTNQDL